MPCSGLMHQTRDCVEYTLHAFFLAAKWNIFMLDTMEPTGKQLLYHLQKLQRTMMAYNLNIISNVRVRFIDMNALIMIVGCSWASTLLHSVGQVVLACSGWRTLSVLTGEVVFWVMDTEPAYLRGEHIAYWLLMWVGDMCLSPVRSGVVGVWHLAWHVGRLIWPPHQLEQDIPKHFHCNSCLVHD